MQPINIIKQTLHVVHKSSHAIKVKKDTMLSLLVLYAPVLALLRVNLLKTWCLWTSENIMFHLLFLRNEPTDDGSYMR
jgi:hypothetical protein